MINSSTTVTVNDNALNSDLLDGVLSFHQNDDTFSRLIVRPLMVLTAIVLGATMLFASAFFVLIALALTPLIALSVWVLKSKVERDLAQARPVDDSVNESNHATFTDGQSCA